MADPRVFLNERARELSNYELTAKISFGLEAFVLANLFAMTLTLQLDDGTIINAVDGVNIKNTGRGTIDAAGNLLIRLVPADNPIVDDTLIEELHVAFVHFEWNGGSSKSWQEIAFNVRNAVALP